MDLQANGDARHRIVFIDAYDSYSNNIVSLLRELLDVDVELIHIDDERFVHNSEKFSQYLSHFDGILVGPGPGHPENTEDIGLIGKVWTSSLEYKVPVLGVCLGFQSLCLTFGATVERLSEPRHGLVTEVTHCGTDIFEGAGTIYATQYHSLRVNIHSESVIVTDNSLWNDSDRCPEMIPLAWDLSDPSNGPILMAARHKSWPFWGVQYHPESICTNSEGRKLLEEWWEQVCSWNGIHRRIERRPSYSKHSTPAVEKFPRNSLPLPNGRTVLWSQVQLSDHIDVLNFVDSMREDSEPHQPIVLQSGLRDGQLLNPETGRFSIIALQDGTSIHIRYSTASRQLTVTTGRKVLEQRFCSIQTIYLFLEKLQQGFSASNGCEQSPFWGGLVGFISHEAGLEGINIPTMNRNAEHPDVWFVLCERSVVVNHSNNVAYVQSIKPEDMDWIRHAAASIRQSIGSQHEPYANDHAVNKMRTVLTEGPDPDIYCTQVVECQEHLRTGSSYELCLTAQTKLHCSADPWEMYCRLSKLNPAPFAAYFSQAPQQNARGISIASSSPERFLSWSRRGKCQFRPIKGTVRKSPGVDLEVASRILGTAKERAENLMIVDLIRNDLNKVSADGAIVPKLMSIEEYETVFQLVSVIEGELGSVNSGIAALAAALPPGSMTGAPKKRSCELLQQLEGDSALRGIYSGVIGYIEVGGGGDFSVIIRTAFKWDDEDWRIGAGGAITVLSDPVSEYEEMRTKRETLLKAFGVDSSV